MSLEVTAEPMPLATDNEDVVRVGGTRVTPDTVAAAFNEGCTAETIVDQYPSLRLSDVYLVLGYYLAHRDGVEAYLHIRRQRSEQVRKEAEARFDPAGVRARLLARQKRGDQ